jgi:DNA end-binding protein Ku
MAPQSTETMEISEFVKIADIDPIYYDTSYYALPEPGGKKPYQLLVAAMEKSGYAAIAKVGMHRREYIVVIRPRANGLTLHTMHYRNEVRALRDYGAKDKSATREKEVELAEQLVKKLAGTFKPEQYEDEYRSRILKLLEAKAKGKSIKPETHRKMAPVVDLMAALRKSVGQSASGKSATRTHAKKSRTSKPAKAA